MPDTPLPPAGWYLDPEQPALQRYWDGLQWTTSVAPAPTTALASSNPPPPEDFPNDVGPLHPDPAQSPDVTPQTAYQPGAEFIPDFSQDDDAGDAGPQHAVPTSVPAPAPAPAPDEWEARSTGATHWSEPAAAAPPPTSPAKRRVSPGAIIAAVIAVAALAIGGAWLASSMRTSQDAQHDSSTIVDAATGGGVAADLAASTDATQLGMRIDTYASEFLAPPTVTVEGREYVLSNTKGELERMRMADGVEFGGSSGTSDSDWCVWVTAPAGDVKDFQSSAQGGSGPGNCR